MFENVVKMLENEVSILNQCASFYLGKETISIHRKTRAQYRLKKEAHLSIMAEYQKAIELLKQHYGTE